MYSSNALSRWKIPERFLKDSDSTSVLLGRRRYPNKLENKSSKSVFQDDNRETLSKKRLLLGLRTVCTEDPGKTVSAVNAETGRPHGKKSLENKEHPAGEEKYRRKENHNKHSLEPREKYRLENDRKQWRSDQSKFQKGFPNALYSSSNSDLALLPKCQSSAKMKEEEKAELPRTQTWKHGKEDQKLSRRSSATGQVLQLPPLPLKNESKPVKTSRRFHLRLLTPTTRAKKMLFQTWHGRPTYHDYYTSYIGSFFSNSHRSLPHEYVIHPDWD